MRSPQGARAGLATWRWAGDWVRDRIHSAARIDRCRALSCV